MRAIIFLLAVLCFEATNASARTYHESRTDRMTELLEDASLSIWTAKPQCKEIARKNQRELIACLKRSKNDYQDEACAESLTFNFCNYEEQNQ